MSSPQSVLSPHPQATPAPPASPAPDWTTQHERGSPALMHVMAWLSLTLGRGVSRVLLRFIALYFVLFAPASRKASQTYLARVFGRAAGWREVYAHFFAFASVVHDRIFFTRGHAAGFDVSLHGESALTAALDGRQGVFLIGAHLGSFEALHAMAHPHAQLRAVMVMHEENARKIGALMRALNPRAAQDIIALGKVDSMMKVMERLQEGCAIGMLADRSPVPDTMQRVDFLGAPAEFPTGPLRMAALLKRPVLFMAGLYLGGNRYAIHFEPLADFSIVSRGDGAAAIEAATRRYAQLLEQYCRKAPGNWFNFYDFWRSAQ